ncbi:STAS domain-containing protein [Spartinivicinus poritis]|uniref:STAS domain-containing protein n=1 Tax=Spartinivicinus poritis TaxID=2994640 RepID=A0ABT5UFZ6_9GAMM|nr:STAS domain-containing protein [Spartinivicinus sp. A2-2]MDE1465309.1 STAS domain-containing protein [Spartinivicinus sp. A2-2]
MVDNLDSDFKATISGNKLTIRIGKAFTLVHFQHFKTIYNKLEKIQTCEIDFQLTEYIDSSALGALLLMKQHFNLNKENFHLINCRKFISRILYITNFHQVFSVQS